MTRTRGLVVIVVLLILAGTYNTVQVVSSADGLRTAQQTINTNQARIKSLVLENRQRVTTLVIQRKATVRLICHTTNEVVRNLRALIVSGTKAGRIFNKLFSQFHAPPYQARVRMAEAQAQSIQPVDCPALR